MKIHIFKGKKCKIKIYGKTLDLRILSGRIGSKDYKVYLKIDKCVQKLCNCIEKNSIPICFIIVVN